MLNFRWNRTVSDQPTTTVTTTRDDLRIRNLLDDPRLAHAMTLDLGPAFAAAAPVTDLALGRNRPERVFNRRRLLESDAAETGARRLERRPAVERGRTTRPRSKHLHGPA